jgi:hypothetical protein
MSQVDTRITQVISDLDRLAARQLGLVSSAQLSQLGFTRRQIDRRVGNDRLITVRRGVYRVASAPLSWEQAVLAAALAAGDGATISHTTAAAVWDLKHIDRQRAGLHVTANRQLRIDGVVGHVGRLAPGERLVQRGIPITTPERTLVDLAEVLTPARLGECVDDALRRKLIGLSRLRRTFDQANATTGGGRRGLAWMKQVLAERHPDFRPPDSDWEREMDRLWDRLGLPAAERQYRVANGGRTFKLDRAIPELKIGIEWNGFETHGTCSAFHRDSDRQADLTAGGWFIIPFTSRSTPQRITRTVLRAIEDRRRLFEGAGASPKPS